MKVTLFREAEVLEPADLDAIGQAARETDRNITGGAIDYPHHWADFGVAAISAVEVRVSEGRLFQGDTIYDLDAPATVNLQPRLPLALSDRVYVALLVRGETQTLEASRLIEVDADTEETVLEFGPKTEVRRVTMVEQAGLPGPTPLKPTLAADACCLCWVELSPTGIVSIEMYDEHRVKTLAEVEARVTVLEGDVRDSQSRTATIETDIANVASQLTDVPRPTVIRQLQRDVAAARRLIELPDEARAYWYDAGLVYDAWDRTHPDWLARIGEGVRFPYAAERDAQLALINPADPALRIYENLLMPAWTERPRIVVDGVTGSKNISQAVHVVTDAVLREISRERIIYGPSHWVCENTAEWSFLYGRQIGETFQRDGETFEILQMSKLNKPGHRGYFIRQAQVDNYVETYWDYVTNSYGLNGSTFGQTFLVSQPMIATSLDLWFTRVATAGDVHVMLCETNESAAPDPTKAIVAKSLTPEQLSLGWVNFPFRPSLLDAGKRYAWVVVTTGNHALGTVAGNKFAQGTLFQFSDGAWAQGSLDEDFPFRLNAGLFAATRTVAEFDPLTLSDGMTQLDMLYSSWAPGGTELSWEIKPSGASAWTALKSGDPAALIGLPALTQIRAVFIGTTDLQPALVLDATARGRTYRHRGDMRAVSVDHAFGFATQTVQMETVVDHFDPAVHTMQNTLIAGGAVVTPASTTIVADINRPGRYTYFSVFTLAAPVTSARARPLMTTSNVVDMPFVQNIALYAL